MNNETEKYFRKTRDCHSGNSRENWHVLGENHYVFGLELQQQAISAVVEGHRPPLNKYGLVMRCRSFAPLGRYPSQQILRRRAENISSLFFCRFVPGLEVLKQFPRHSFAREKREWERIFEWSISRGCDKSSYSWPHLCDISWQQNSLLRSA